MTTSIDSPAFTRSGYESTLGGSNSGSDEVMLVIRSGAQPLLLMVSSSSAKEPMQASPKFPASAMAVATEPHGAIRMPHAPRPNDPVTSWTLPPVSSPCRSFIFVFGSAGSHLVHVFPRSKDRYSPRSVPTNKAGIAGCQTAKSVEKLRLLGIFPVMFTQGSPDDRKCQTPLPVMANT